MANVAGSTNDVARIYMRAKLVSWFFAGFGARVCVTGYMLMESMLLDIVTYS